MDATDTQESLLVARQENLRMLLLKNLLIVQRKTLGMA
jgi:hypothetical protein